MTRKRKLAAIAVDEFERDYYDEEFRELDLTADITEIRAQLEQLYGKTATRHPAADLGWRDFARLITIKTPTGLAPMELWGWQEELLALFESHGQVLLNKSRQQSCSTLSLLYILKKCLEGTETAIVTHYNGAEAFKLARRFRSMLQSIADNSGPNGERYDAPTMLVDNLGQMIFEGTKSIVAFGSPGNAGRGTDMASLYLYDEAAFFGEIGGVGILKDAIAAAAPGSIMSESPKTIVVSTPNGSSSNDYWDLLAENNGAVKILDYINDVRSGAIAAFSHFVDVTGWLKVTIHWSANPYLKAKFKDTASLLKWAVETLKIPLPRARREFDLDFSSGSRSFLAHELIMSRATGSWADGALGLNRGGKVPFTPVDGATYALCGDTAGDGADNTVFLVLEILKDNHINVIDFYKTGRGVFDRQLARVIALIDRYNVTRIEIERNHRGDLFKQALDIAYAKTDNGIDKEIHAIATTKSNRSSLLEFLATEIESGTITYPVSFVTEELAALEDKNGKVQAASGFKDDSVFALVHGVNLVRNVPIMVAPAAKKSAFAGRVKIAPAS